MIPSHQELVARDLVDVAGACAAAEGVTVERMFSRERWASLVRARRRFYCHLRELGWSLPAIGAFVGRDHVTILYALRGGRPRSKLAGLALAALCSSGCGSPFASEGLESGAADAGADVAQLDQVAGDVAVDVVEEAPHDALAGDVAGDQVAQLDAGADVGREASCAPLEAGTAASWCGPLPIPGQYCANVTTQAGTTNEPAAMPAACACEYSCACLLANLPAAAPCPAASTITYCGFQGGALTVTCP